MHSCAYPMRVSVIDAGLGLVAMAASGSLTERHRPDFLDFSVFSGVSFRVITPLVRKNR